MNDYKHQPLLKIIKYFGWNNERLKFDFYIIVIRIATAHFGRHTNFFGMVLDEIY